MRVHWIEGRNGTLWAWIDPECGFLGHSPTIGHRVQDCAQSGPVCSPPGEVAGHDQTKTLVDLEE